MIRTIFLLATLSLYSTAYGQDAKSHDHQSHEHENHDHMNHEHEAEAQAHHEKKSDDHAATSIKLTPEIEAALAAGGEPVVADVLGVVCDFCAKAMNKTFGKREEIAAVYVDLDDKTLSLVFKPGQTLDDETVEKLVKKSGYRIKNIRRGADALKGEHHETDAS